MKAAMKMMFLELGAKAIRSTGAARLLLLAATLILASGCASNIPTADEHMVLVSVKASDQINPDINQRPSPVELHLYFLRNATAFLEQDYYSLAERPEQVLAQDLISKESMFISPGELEHKVFRVEGEYEHIGVVVSFRDLDGSQWRDLAGRPAKGLVSAVWPERWTFGRYKRSLYLVMDEKQVSVSGPIK